MQLEKFHINCMYLFISHIVYFITFVYIKVEVQANIRFYAVGDQYRLSIWQTNNFSEDSVFDIPENMSLISQGNHFIC